MADIHLLTQNHVHTKAWGSMKCHQFYCVGHLWPKHWCWRFLSCYQRFFCSPVSHSNDLIELLRVHVIFSDHGQRSKMSDVTMTKVGLNVLESCVIVSECLDHGWLNLCAVDMITYLDKSRLMLSVLVTVTCTGSKQWTYFHTCHKPFIWTL